jgi:hypothetical protein
MHSVVMLSVIALPSLASSQMTEKKLLNITVAKPLLFVNDDEAK